MSCAVAAAVFETDTACHSGLQFGVRPTDLQHFCRSRAGSSLLEHRGDSMVTMEPVLNPVPQFPENNYKMSEEDVKRLIEFRASNEALFTGKRNSAKIAWSTILKGLGLEGKLTADQIAKKWDNLRSKYKDLKQPYQGQNSMEGVVESWPWFHIMENAMQGRLYNRNYVLSPDIGGSNNYNNNNNNNNNNVHIISNATQLCNGHQNPDNADILEFLIKTEMEDSVAADDRKVVVGHPSFEGTPLSWRRMSDCSYKMTEPETEKMIKLRAANEALFTGRRNSAKPAWRAILHQLGLQEKLTTDQLSKKWDNMKRRYKELRFPAPGVETNPGSWPWFYRMSDALEGRLTGSAPILTALVEEGDDECEPLSPAPVPRKRPRRSRRTLTEFLIESDIDLLVENQDRNGPSVLGDLHRLTEFNYKLSDDDTRRLIELRAANESLFTGRRNSAKPAWRGIVKKMGLAGRITPDQVAKKWDNLKTKYKYLRFPPRGMEGQTNPASWPWFQLMSDALEGRLAGKAPTVTHFWSGEEDNIYSSSPSADRDCLLLAAERGSVSELESVVGGDSGEAEGNVTYTDTSAEEGSAPCDPSYKMTDLDTRRMIKLRAANEPLFTGRRNTAKAAWKAILKELGLLGKVSTHQMAKKWDNLKRRYKDLRFPPVGMESGTDPALSWPWFHLMNEAMEGRLAHSERLLSPVTQEDEELADAPCTQCSCSAPPHPAPPPSLPSSQSCKQEALANSGEQRHLSRDVCEAPQGCLRQGWEEVARERAALKQEREMVERERASLERERAALQAERLWLEQERAGLEQRPLMLNSVGHQGHLGGLM